MDSTQLLRSDITALQAECQLDTATVCRMLLAAPRLALVPASFWHLLLQYMLFLVPHWRQQVRVLRHFFACMQGCVVGWLSSKAAGWRKSVYCIESHGSLRAVGWKHTESLDIGCRT